MKKTLIMLLALLTMLCVCPIANAAEQPDDEAVIIEPFAVIYQENLSGEATPFTSATIRCTSSGGDSLRYWFDNTGSTACTVQLFKKTVLGLAYTQEPFTVAAGSNRYQVLNGVEGKDYVLRVTSVNNAAISGTLKANQLSIS